MKNSINTNSLAQQNQLMQNFNIRYECLDARDDYRAQMKKGVDPLFVGNWEDTTDDIENPNNPSLNANIEFDDESSRFAKYRKCTNIKDEKYCPNQSGFK
jgi:hypothetical protein